MTREKAKQKAKAAIHKLVEAAKELAAAEAAYSNFKPKPKRGITK